MEVVQFFDLHPPRKKGGFSLPPERNKRMSRLETMAKRIEKVMPEFVELVPPTERSEGLYRRIRHIQITGECCGHKMSLEQLKEIIALASRESVRDACLYLCRVLDRLHIERTLETANNRLKLDRRLYYVSSKVKLAMWQMKYLSDLIHGKYSENDIACALEIAMKKKNPQAYFIGIFKKGYKAPQKSPSL